jgi:hypothetical protein
MPPKTEKTADVAPDVTPEELYKTRFNATAKRLSRQLDALQKLASARKATPTDEQRQKAVQWLEREVSVTVAALKGAKVVTKETGPLG